MGAEDRMLGRNRPVGCPSCRTAHVGPDCLDRGKTRREARKVEKRATAGEINGQLRDDDAFIDWHSNSPWRFGIEPTLCPECGWSDYHVRETLGWRCTWCRAVFTDEET